MIQLKPINLYQTMFILRKVSKNTDMKDDIGHKYYSHSECLAELNIGLDHIARPLSAFKDSLSRIRNSLFSLQNSLDKEYLINLWSMNNLIGESTKIEQNIDWIRKELNTFDDVFRNFEPVVLGANKEYEFRHTLGIKKKPNDAQTSIDYAFGFDTFREQLLNSIVDFNNPISNFETNYLNFISHLQDFLKHGLNSEVLNTMNQHLNKLLDFLDRFVELHKKLHESFEIYEPKTDCIYIKTCEDKASYERIEDEAPYERVDDD